jgi:hypothetical protein
MLNDENRVIRSKNTQVQKQYNQQVKTTK